jgi:hypothetical protein
MPNPFDRILPDAKFKLRADALADKPGMAAIVTMIFALWAEVEYYLAQLLTQILRDDTGPAIAIYETLRSQSMQRQALNAAAGAALSPEDYDLFDATMSLVEGVSTPRHQLAHWLWVVCEQRPELLALADPKKMRVNMGRARRFLLEFEPGVPNAREILDDRKNTQIIDPQFVVGYSKTDLENAERNLREVRGIVAVVGLYFDHEYFKTLLSSNRFGGRVFPLITAEEFRKQFREGLLKLPRLSDALDRVRRRRSGENAD